MGILPVNYDRILRDVTVIVLDNLNPHISILKLELKKPEPDILVIREAVYKLDTYIPLCDKARPHLVIVANDFSNFSKAVSFTSAVSNLDSTIKEAREMLEKAKKYLRDLEIT